MTPNLNKGDVATLAAPAMDAVMGPCGVKYLPCLPANESVTVVLNARTLKPVSLANIWALLAGPSAEP
jgi:hypothetical protein